METGGYVGVFDSKTKTIKFHYNTDNSYPSYLLKDVLEEFSPCVASLYEEDTLLTIQEDFYELIEIAKDGNQIGFNDFDELICFCIDYIYIIDYNKKCVYCFEKTKLHHKYYYKLFAIIPEDLFEIFIKRVIDFLENVISNKKYNSYRDAVMNIFRTVDFREIDENKIKDILLVDMI